MPKLDPDILTRPSDSNSSKKIPGKKKSLFAQMFEKKGPGFFGINPMSSMGATPLIPHGERDRVEPVSIGGDIVEQSRDMEYQPAQEGVGGTQCSGGEALKENFSSTAAATWDRYRTRHMPHACCTVSHDMHVTKLGSSPL